MDLGNRFCAVGYSKFYSLARLFQPGFLSSYYSATSLSSDQFAFSSCSTKSKGDRRKRADWNWRIIGSSIVVFSLLTYGLVYIQKRPTINSISIIQLNQGGTTAHVTNFFSSFIPDDGNFQIHVPAKSLAQPITNTFLQSDPDIPNTDENIDISVGQNETNINLQNASPWTLHRFVSEADQTLQGSLLSHLALHNGTLTGTVTNKLGTDLNDVYILINHSFAYLGNLPAQQIQQVNISLHSSTLSSGSTLADQIAKANHLPVPYFPFASGSQPKNDIQLHLAILSALSGEGFTYSTCGGPCSTYAIAGKHSIITPLFGAPKLNPIDENDPLLVTGAPATLIGWSNNRVDTTNNVTVNGASPGGTFEDFVQVPLNVDLSPSSSLPPGLINGQVINAQGNEVQTTSPGVYTINTGSITFEFSLPGAVNLQVNNLTISAPIVMQNTGINQVPARLYNWNTNSWDAITLNNNSFTTTNIKAYTSSDGRVLLQVFNQNASQSTTLFWQTFIEPEQCCQLKENRYGEQTIVETIKQTFHCSSRNLLCDCFNIRCLPQTRIGTRTYRWTHVSGKSRI